MAARSLHARRRLLTPPPAPRGLDNAGKSSVVARWLGADSIQRVAPTFGFAIHTVAWPPAPPRGGAGKDAEGAAEQGSDRGARGAEAPARPCQVHIWDIGGQRTIRPYWRNYFGEADGLVFVLDAASPGRLAEALAELAGLLGEGRLAAASVLLLANKQDCAGSLGVEAIAAALSLATVLGPARAHWRLAACSALRNGDGAIERGLDWLVADIASRR